MGPSAPRVRLSAAAWPSSVVVDGTATAMTTLVVGPTATSVTLNAVALAPGVGANSVDASITLAVLGGDDTGESGDAGSPDADADALPE